MTNAVQEQDVTVRELDASYASLDDKPLEDLGEVLLTEATDAEPPRLLLDLSRTQFIGSRFIELLVRAWKRIRALDGAMALCGVQPLCAEVFQVSRLDTLWSSYPTREEGLSALAGPGTCRTTDKNFCPSNKKDVGRVDQAEGRR
jgi:anti-anti-sigma factor